MIKSVSSPNYLLVHMVIYSEMARRKKTACRKYFRIEDEKNAENEWIILQI